MPEELERAGCQVVFLERPPTGDPQDALLIQIRGAVAEYERAVIADRMRRGRLAYVNCVTPAVIATEILTQLSDESVAYMTSRIPMGRTGQPEEVAALVAWLASDECSFSTGAVFDISGGRATY